MTEFFSKYPKTDYDLLIDGSLFSLTDITRSVILNTNKIQDDSVLYTYYEILDGERPDIISHKLYGDVQYYWTFFIVNDILRDGYMSSWPLSYLNFNKMIEREYNKYSAITLLPTLDQQDLNGTGKIDISLIPLDAKYLPYLRLVSDDNKLLSRIAKYDASRSQLVVYDCHIVVDNRRQEIVRETFIENKSIEYKIVCDESMPIALKNEWLKRVHSNIIKYDLVGNDENVIFRKPIHEYIFNKTLSAAPVEYRWSNYVNAAYEYLTPDDESINVYDVLTNPKIVFPKYKSFYEHETEINDSKRFIKVIREDFIQEFSKEYFNTLLS